MASRTRSPLWCAYSVLSSIIHSLEEEKNNNNVIEVGRDHASCYTHSQPPLSCAKNLQFVETTVHIHLRDHMLRQLDALISCVYYVDFTSTKWTQVHLMRRFTYQIIPSHRCSRLSARDANRALALSHFGLCRVCSTVDERFVSARFSFFTELKFASISGCEMMYDAVFTWLNFSCHIEHWTQHFLCGAYCTVWQFWSPSIVITARASHSPKKQNTLITSASI